MKPFIQGWMLFSEYLRIRNIKRDGQEIRDLSKLQNKINITPTAPRATWAVKVNEADEVFARKIK